MEAAHNTTNGKDSEGGEARANELIRANVRAIAQMEAAARENRTPTDRIVDAISSFCGSLAFVYIHVVWFGLWLAINLWPHSRWRFDPFPFSLLTMLVSLEAILLSTFILITENRQAQTADRRNHLDLQINMLSEQENSKILAMLARIQRRLGIEDEDPDVHVLSRGSKVPAQPRAWTRAEPLQELLSPYLEQATEPEKVVDEIKRYVEETSADEGPRDAPERRA